MAVSGSLGPSVEELVSTNTVNTGSIHITDNVTASFFTGSFIGDGSEIHNLTITGATNLLAFYGSDNHLTSSYFAHITNSGNTLGLGTDAYNNNAPERLIVDNGKSFNIATFQTSYQNNFAEVNIKNFGSGSNASADLVIWNDASTEETSYLDLGLNSSNYTSNFVGYANDAYLYNAANDLYVGSISTGSHGHLHLFGGNLWNSSSISVYNDGTIGINTDKFNNSAATIPSSGDGYAVEISGSVKFLNNAHVSGTITTLTGLNAPKLENNGHNWYFNDNGNMEAAGSITASYFQGDGSQLTNLPVQNIDTGSLATTGSNTFDGNQIINGEVTASFFSGDASGLTNVPFHITGSDIFGNTVDKTFTKLQFDDSTGLNVEETDPGTAFISIGSHFKDIFIEGQTLLSATGSDAFEIIPEGGIDITTSITDTNSNGYIKEIKFSALALSSSLDSRILEISSSVATNAGAAISDGAYKILVITQPSNTWTFNHGLGQRYPIFQVFDENNKVVIPTEIEAVDSETAIIRFPINVTGRVIASLGTGPGGTSQFVSSSATWSIAHNLGTDYPIVTIWDTNRDIIFPNKIHSVDANNIRVYFSVSKSGFINVAKGGHIVSGSVEAGSIDFTNTNLISGSGQLNALGYAITGSNNFNGNQTITGSLTLRNAKIDSTCTTISSNTTIFNLGAFDGANIDYVVKNGLNMRGGNIMGVWNGSNVKYTETSTMDLGDTTPITFTMTSDGKLNAYVASGTWTVEAMYRALGCSNNNPTPTPTSTPTLTPTVTSTPTLTPTPALSNTPTPTVTNPNSTQTLIPTNTPTPTLTSTPTPTLSTMISYTYVGYGAIVGANDCNDQGPTPNIYLDFTDMITWNNNSGCFTSGMVIRDVNGDPLTGTFYFVYYGSSCSTTTFKSTLGQLTDRPTQC
jgi:hypothetical protein